MLKISGGLYSSASEVIRESLRLIHTYDDVQKHRVIQLNNDIEAGLAQLKAGKRVSSSDSYARTREKVKSLAKKKS